MADRMSESMANNRMSKSMSDRMSESMEVRIYVR